MFKLRAFYTYFEKLKPLANLDLDEQKKDHESENGASKKVILDLDKAEKYFYENPKNLWGLGLVNYLKGRYYMQKGIWKETNARYALNKAIEFFAKIKHLKGVSDS